MTISRQSDIFENNFIYWKVFGLWSGRKPNKYYKFYAFVYLFVTVFLYNILLTLNIAYIPRKIEYFIQELIFYFTEIAVMSRVFMIIKKRDNILQAFNIMDGTDLEVDDETSTNIRQKDYLIFLNSGKIYSIGAHITYFIKILMPIVNYFLFHTELDLPVSKYYFLTEELRANYFIPLYIYQSWGIYGHMMYNVTVDTFIAGLLLTAITQLRILNAKLIRLKLSYQEKKLNLEVQEKIQLLRLQKCLKRYDMLLKYCSTIQSILNVTMFIVFGISSLIICMVMCGLLLSKLFVFMMMYLTIITLEIFVPAYLGTVLKYESEELAYAAYCSEWIPRSKSFNRSVRIFMGRANNPIQMTGLKMFPLSLATFTSIMKSAYSFFTLIRSFQE